MTLVIWNLIIIYEDSQIYPFLASVAIPYRHC